MICLPTTTLTRSLLAKRLQCMWVAILFGVFPRAQGAEVDFYVDVLPILKASCIACHNKTTTKGDLNLETPTLMIQGGDSGPGVVAGQPASSLIYTAAAQSSELIMPPANNKSGAHRLTTGELSILRTWIEQGAKESQRRDRPVSLIPLPPGTQPIYAVAITPGGRFAACGRGNQIHVYDLAKREFATSLNDSSISLPTNAAQTSSHRSVVHCLAFSPDGSRLASGSYREVKIWRRSEAVRSRLIAVPDTDLRPSTTADGVLATSKSNTWMLRTQSDGSLEIAEQSTGKLLHKLQTDLQTQQSSAKLDYVLAKSGVEAAYQKSEIARIEAQNKSLDELLSKANETLASVKKTLPEKQANLKSADEAVSLAKKTVEDLSQVSAGTSAGAGDEALAKQKKESQEKLATAQTAYDAARAMVMELENHLKDAEGEVDRIANVKAKNALALTSANESITQIKLVEERVGADLKSIREATGKDRVRFIAGTFVDRDSVVATVSREGIVSAWAARTGSPLMQKSLLDVSDAVLTWSHIEAGSGSSFTVQSDEGAQVLVEFSEVWQLERTIGSVNSSEPFPDRVNAVSFSPDGRLLAVGSGEPSRSGDITLWNTANGELVKHWSDHHRDSILSLDFTSDGKLLASGAADRIARVTEIGSGQVIHVFEGHTHHVMSVAFRVDDRVLATAGADNVVVVWDMHTGERKKKIEGWAKEITALQFIGGTNQIVCSSGDNLIRIVKDEGGEVRSIPKLPEFMQCVTASTYGGIMIAGGDDGVLRTWDVAGNEQATFPPHETGVSTPN